MIIYVLLLAQAVDSAAVARREYQNAIADLRKGDTVAAELKLLHAARAYPVQPVYPIAHASIAAKRGDTAALITSLNTLARFGLSHDIDADDDFVNIRNAPALREVAARLRENRTPPNRSIRAFKIPDSTFFMEGFAHDAATGNWYVPSVRNGSIIVRLGNGTWKKFAGEQPCASMAAAVDLKARKLWVIRAPLPQNAKSSGCRRSSLDSYDLRNGHQLDSFPAPDVYPHAFGDIALSSTGDIYVSDTRSSAVYVLRSGSRELKLLSSDRFLRSPQGMAITTDGATMLVADYSHGLARVDTRTGATSQISAPPDASLVGIDGLVLSGRSLIAIQNGVVPARVLRLSLSPDWARVQRVDVLDRIVDGEPTLGKIVGENFYFVGNSQWAFYKDDGSRRPEPLPFQYIRKLRVTETPGTSH